MGGSSLTAGIVSIIPLSRKFTLTTSVQAGAMAFGASNNPSDDAAPRPYNYGLGPMVKLEARLAHQSLGTISAGFERFDIVTIEGTIPEPDEAFDHLNIVKARWAVPIVGGFGLRAGYALYLRRTRFEGLPSVARNLSQIGLSVFYNF